MYLHWIIAAVPSAALSTGMRHLRNADRVSRVEIVSEGCCSKRITCNIAGERNIFALRMTTSQAGLAVSSFPGYPPSSLSPCR